MVNLPASLLPTEESPAPLAWHTGPFMIWFLPISPVSSLTTHLLSTLCSSLAILNHLHFLPHTMLFLLT